jgi:serine/threonine-protein kinase
MTDEADEPDPFADLNAAGALRAAFQTLEPPIASGRASAAETAAASAPSSPERRGYERDREIARGGMGVIVKAFDRELTRDVALKVLRDELGSDAKLVRRFVEEARITARLDHPGIVPVYQIGADERGRPYFAMRLVRGRDLRRILELVRANEEGWSRTRALSVILKVCEAMAYAHERGVIHRDLKPSNVMVGEFGEVYVMDWGLARVLGEADARDLRLRARATIDASDARDARGAARELESPILTVDGEVLGTPCYMSPEQAQGRIGELGPRSDVYSVGALLYHLLAGEMPYVPAGTSVASREVLARLVERAPRALDEIRRDVPAELVAICEKAMERDADDRYASMLAMAEDLRAFLERRVVRAYETGAWAESRKWVQRNKPFALALAAVIVALIAGIIASLVLKAQSDANLARAEKTASFLKQTLSGVKPSVAAGRDTAMLREMMDGAASRIEKGELKEAPEAELDLSIMIGNAYRDIAEFDKAESVLKRAVEAGRKLAGGNHRLRALAASNLGLVYLDRSDFAAAEPLVREALETSTRISADGAETAMFVGNLASVMQARGDYAGAEPLYRREIAMIERLWAGDNQDLAVAINNLASVRANQGDLAEAEALSRRALAIEERLHPGDDPELATNLDTIGVLRQMQGDLDGAQPLHQRALEIRRRVFTHDHPLLATSLNNMGVLFYSRGDPSSAEPYFREALEMRGRLFHGDQAETAQVSMSLGAVVARRGELAEAERLMRDALAMQERLFPNGHPEIAHTREMLAEVLQARGDLEQAESMQREAVAMLRRVHPRGDPALASSLTTLSAIAEARGDLAGAESLAREASTMLRALVPGSDVRVATAELELGRVLSKQQRFADAERELVDAERTLATAPMRYARLRDECLRVLATNADAWDAVEPDRGHRESALEWERARAELRK